MSEPVALTIDPAASLVAVQRQLAARFAEAGSDSAAIEARMLISSALNLDHAGFVRESDAAIGAEAAARLETLAARRLKHEPVSRILGKREFFGLDLAIDPHVLDPRPDTETIVEAAIEAMGSRRDAALRILDLGTGSGAILCALLASFPKATGLGVDVSDAACKVAATNLAALGLADRATIRCTNWTELSGTFDVIVSNPPYIAHADIAALAPDVRDFDPHLALDGGADGYDAYRGLAVILPKLLAPQGIAVLELGQGQAATVAQLLSDAGLKVLGTKPDLAGIARAILASRA